MSIPMRQANLYTGIQQALGKIHKSRNGRDTINLGKKIRELRERSGVSGAELCRRSGGIDPRTLNAIEKGRIRTPSIDMLQAIAGGLGCLVRDLFTQAEVALGRNFHVGSAKGAFQMEFPSCGVRIVSLMPTIREFFCGKMILGPRAKVQDEVPIRSCPMFIEVVMGKIELVIEGERISLKEGENVLFNGSLEHQIQNPLNREAVLWMVTAPSFFRA